MRVAGIDSDTKSITWSIIETALPNAACIGRVEAKGRRAEDRFVELVKAFEERVPDFKSCCWVYLELPMAGPNMGATINQAAIVGAIRTLFIQHNIPHSLVSVGTWKKNVLGSGAATKEEIKNWAIQHYHIDQNREQDAFDATAIAAFGVRTGALP